MLFNRLAALSGFAVIALFAASPANALTMAECSTKYNAAKEAGALDGQNWTQFRKAECGADAAAETKKKVSSSKKAKATEQEKAAGDNSAKGLSAKECSAKYNAAKEADALNGMKWNDFRKAQCGPGATADLAPAKAKKTTKAAAAAATETDEQTKGLSAKECSAKYQAAKDTDALNGMKWNDFRKAECGPGATADLAPAEAKKSTKAAASTETDEQAKGLSAKECSAKYQAAKDTDALNGMKWNDFRKAECGPGATADLAPAEAKKSAKAAAASNDTAGETQGLSMKECSAKYQGAKADGSLGGMKWNDFRKTECGANASDDDTVPSFDEASYTKEPEVPVTRAPRGVQFPSGISRKLSDESPSKARMHTCLEQYYANKDADKLGGLRWIQKGGGYYSLCNAKLKEAAG